MSRDLPTTNGCTPVLELPGSEEDVFDTQCAKIEQGFDIVLSAILGANVYSLVGPYAKVSLVTPVRIHVC